MKKRLLALAVFTSVIAGASYAQQDKALTHFMYDKMSVNPGETGIYQGFCATSIYRNQWDKINGAPNTGILNLEGNLERWFPVGAGISFYHDQIGFTRQTNVMLNLSYHLELPGVGVLGAGAGFGLQNIGMTPDWVPPQTTADNTLPTGYAASAFDANFGLYLKGDLGYYVGLSSTHLPTPELNSTDLLPVTYSTARHYYAMGGYTYALNPESNIEGNVLMRTDLVKFSADINARYIWRNQMYGGLTFRTSDAVAIMLGAQPLKIMSNDRSPLDNLVVGYSYDVSIHKLSSVSRGSHEILLKYCYYLPPVPLEKSIHPRWL